MILPPPPPAPSLPLFISLLSTKAHCHLFFLKANWHANATFVSRASPRAIVVVVVVVAETLKDGAGIFQSSRVNSRSMCTGAFVNVADKVAGVLAARGTRMRRRCTRRGAACAPAGPRISAAFLASWVRVCDAVSHGYEGLRRP